MRKIAVAGLLFALVFLAAGASAQERAPIGVRYVWDGPMGVLSIANAEGLPFHATNALGMFVAGGVVASPVMELVVPNFGPEYLLPKLVVHVGPVTFNVTDKEWLWE